MAKTETTDQPLTMSVIEAGKALGVGKAAAYEAARRGEIPTLRIGRFLRVPRAAFTRLLETAGKAA